MSFSKLPESKGWRDYRWITSKRGRSLVLRNGNPKQPDISIAKFGMGTGEVGEAHSTVLPKGQQNLWLGKGLYFRGVDIGNIIQYWQSPIRLSN